MPSAAASAEVIDQGRTLYNGHCGMCHGPNAISGSVLPDLRYMTPETHKIFTGILAGAYASKGMPPVMHKLHPDQVEAIHQYIIKRAHDLKAVVAKPAS